MKLINKNIYIIFFLFGTLFQSCSKKQDIGVNPYEGAKEPLGIVFTTVKASPEAGLPGETIILNVKGLLKYENQFKIYLNNVEAEVVDLTASTIEIRIPQEVSSGNVTIILNNQIFYGPRVGVEGKASVDVDFKIVNGFDGYVSQILPNLGGFIVTGYFNNFENQATNANIINSIHFLNSLGQSATTMAFRRSAVGSIRSIAKLPNGQFMVAGGLVSFSNRAVGSIARLNAGGSLDTTVVAVINPNSEDRPLDGFDTVSTFNGGLNGFVTNVFPAEDDKVIAVGTFASHYKIDYNYSSRENRRAVISRVNDVAKMKADGSLDSTFSFNNTGFNGFVNNAVQLNDGRVVIVGSFSSFNGRPAKNIICIKPNGEVDNTFAPGGTDKEIIWVTYNPTTDKIAFAGAFTQFAGASSNGVALMNGNGTVDQTFQFANVKDGIPSFAYPLTNGRVFVQGSFMKYNNVDRSGLLILEANGAAKQEYNNLGRLIGIVTTLVETTSSLGNPAILLGGSILSVDGKSVGNIVKIEVKN